MRFTTTECHQHDTKQSSLTSYSIEQMVVSQNPRKPGIKTKTNANSKRMVSMPILSSPFNQGCQPSSTTAPQNDEALQGLTVQQDLALSRADRPEAKADLHAIQHLLALQQCHLWGWANTPLPAGWLLLVLKGKLAGRNMCSSEVSILCHILAALRPWHIEGSRAHGDSYGTTDDLPWMKHVKFTKNMSDTSGLVLLSVFCSSDSCVINLESPPYLWYPMTISSLSHPANSPSPVSCCNVFTYAISFAPISILDQSGHYRNNSQTCPPVLQTAALIWIIRHKSRGWI